jgi:predicted ATPase/DNA-binding SARP family transcriptional activator
MLRIYMLGNFHVERDGTAIPAADWARRKTKSLLKLLALQPGHRLHREQITEMLWPDLDPISARDNFYRNLSFLRHILEPGLERPANSHFLSLEAEVLKLGPPGEVWIDVDAFEGLIAQARTSPQPLPLLEEALGLYGGELLPEDAYEEWAIARRDLLSRAAIKALLTVAEARREEGAYEPAIAALQRVLSLERTQEQAHSELMRVYALAGRRHDALRQYEQCAKVLQAELNVEPEPETTELYKSIAKGDIAGRVPSGDEPSLRSWASTGLAGSVAKARSTRHSPAPGPVPLNNLPGAGAPLIGREREVDEACRHLRRPEVRLLTMTGTAGIGKTRLAIEVAHALLKDFRNGALFVPLAPLQDATLVLPAIAQALGLKEGGDRRAAESVKTFLRDTEVLMVLDNFEHVIQAASALAEILSSCPGLKVLVTSRELLRLTLEHDFPVQPLSLPDLAHLPPPHKLADYASICLFSTRAAAVKPGFALTPDNAAAVAEICSRLDGLPLAIELAAARVRLLAPQAILARLSNRLLTGGARDLPERQQTLYNAIGWSYDLLSPMEQAMFARLSVFAGGCTEEAAAAICYEPEDEDGDRNALDDLSLLGDKSLLRHVDAPALANGTPASRSGYPEPRFMMLGTVREYARERLAESGELIGVQERHANYYLSIAEAGEEVWFTAEQQYWLERFDQEQYNFQAALAWALQNDPDVALRLGGALWRYWLAHGYLTEGRRWLEEAIAGVPRQRDGVPGFAHAPDRPGRTKALFGAGVLATHQSDYARATELIAQSLGVARSIGDDLQIANSLVGLGISMYYRGEYDRSVVQFEEALPIFRRLGHVRGTTLALNSLSSSILCLGDNTRAATLAKESLDLSRGIGDSLSVAASLATLGRAVLQQGDAERAVALFEESLAIRVKLKDKGGMAHTLSFLGNAALARGEVAEAARLYAQSLALRHEMGDREGQAAPLEGLAAVAESLGNLERASRLYGAAEALRDAIGAPLPPTEFVLHSGAIAASLKSGPSGDARVAEWEAGRAMHIDQAVAYAISEE